MSAPPDLPAASEGERRGPTIRECLGAAAAELARSGTASARLDAELLLAEALGVDRARLLIDGRERAPADSLERFGDLLRRRADHEPIAYILGHREFRRITLNVDRSVLIPRPETELLVEAGLMLAPGTRVVDVGTGSGAIALALADERPDLDVWATELSRPALELARANATRLGLSVQLRHGDLLEPVPAPVGAVIANLPYVCRGDSLPPDVRDYEPAGALFAGEDGLEVIRRLVGQLAAIPFVALEHGAGQAPAVEVLLSEAGFADIHRVSDLAGHERVVVARRSSPYPS